MSAYGYCPECGRNDPRSSRERRPNGDTACGFCGKKSPSSRWVVSKSAFDEYKSVRLERDTLRAENARLRRELEEYKDAVSTKLHGDMVEIVGEHRDVVALRRELEEANNTIEAQAGALENVRAESRILRRELEVARREQLNQGELLGQIRTLAAGAIAACEEATEGEWEALHVKMRDVWVIQDDDGYYTADEMGEQDAKAIAECVNCMRALAGVLGKEAGDV